MRSKFRFLEGSMMKYKCLINIGYINLEAEAKSERAVSGYTMSPPDPTQGRFLSLLSLHSGTACSPKKPSVQVSSTWVVPLQYSPGWIPLAFQGFSTKERSCGQAEYKPDPSWPWRCVPQAINTAFLSVCCGKSCPVRNSNSLVFSALQPFWSPEVTAGKSVIPCSEPSLASGLWCFRLFHPGTERR